MEESFEHWSSTFSDASIEDLIVQCVQLGVPAPFAKLAALYQRFIDLAFYEKQTPSNVRSIAACWIRSLESIAIVSFHAEPDILGAFMNARDISMENASKNGYGSPLFIAAVNGQAFMDQFLGGVESEESTQVNKRREHLLCTAFGRHEDSPEA